MFFRQPREAAFHRLPRAIVVEHHQRGANQTAIIIGSSSAEHDEHGEDHGEAHRRRLLRVGLAHHREHADAHAQADHQHDDQAGPEVDRAHADKRAGALAETGEQVAELELLAFVERACSR